MIRVLVGWFMVVSGVALLLYGFESGWSWSASIGGIISGMGYMLGWYSGWRMGIKREKDKA